MKKARYEIVDENGDFVEVFWVLKEAKEFLRPGEKIKVVEE